MRSFVSTARVSVDASLIRKVYVEPRGHERATVCVVMDGQENHVSLVTVPLENIPRIMGDLTAWLARDEGGVFRVVEHVGPKP